MIFYFSSDKFDFECVLVEQDNVSESFLKAPDDKVNFVCPLLPTGPETPKYTLVMGNEYRNNSVFEGDIYQHIPHPGQVCHLSLTRAVESRISQEAKERISSINMRFEKNIAALLSLIRPISLNY
jgi:hypothetical protein